MATVESTEKEGIFQRWVIKHEDDGVTWYFHHDRGWQQGFENAYWFKDKAQAQLICDNINTTSVMIRNAVVGMLNGQPE